MDNSIYVFYWSHWGPQRKCALIVKQPITECQIGLKELNFGQIWGFGTEISSCVKLGSRTTNFIKICDVCWKGGLKELKNAEIGVRKELLRVWKGDPKGHSSPYPFSRWVPPELSIHYLISILDNILVKFEQNRTVRTLQKFELFDKKRLTIFDKVLTPFWKTFPQLKQLFDAKLLI